MSKFVLYEWTTRLGEYSCIWSVINEIQRLYRNHPERHYQIWDRDACWWVDERTIEDFIEMSQLQELIPCLKIYSPSESVDWHEEGF